MGPRLRTALILLAGIGTGSLRDFLFINLNYQIDHIARATPVSFAHSRFQGWVKSWDISDLTRLKWMLAVLFVLGMWALCLLLLKNAGVLHSLWRTVTWVFLGIAAAALMLHGLARWLPVEEASANLLHAIQYPVLLLILQVVVGLFPRTRQQRI